MSIGRNLASALLLFALGNAAHAQSADLRVVSTVSPSTNLVVGQEIVVTITATNDGPNIAQQVLLFWSAPVFQPFVFEIAEPVAPVCDGFEIYDIDPPRINFSYMLPTLAPGEQRTCMARMRARIIPPGNQLLVGADVSSGLTPDPQPANNSVQYQLTFATPTPLTIPAMTTWGLIVMVAGALLLSSLQRR
ncbi:MAG: DUF11 domain-containing protein [Chiayiivirga sp.]|jgi:hypothetical protein|uniref:hypothetical protein n=1 Tax=Chiayiivirga sp. TaxID=2041042 RepID=UPI0025C54348|nr:hypothetical protein [Chiayiivirga sp.]MCI1711019.1 DUF11 domain-containing protein [Chiayiivirga sp.]MCI1728167.1 DUF11 domain-containing protein [Chiayiivirga sp.]